MLSPTELGGRAGTSSSVRDSALDRHVQTCAVSTSLTARDCSLEERLALLVGQGESRVAAFILDTAILGEIRKINASWSLVSLMP